MDHSLEAAALLIQSLSEASRLPSSAATAPSSTPDAATPDAPSATPDAATTSTTPDTSVGDEARPGAASASASRPSRGSLLAPLEFLRQARDHGLWSEAQALVDPAIQLVSTFFHHFGDKLSFFADVKTWLPLVRGPDIEGLVRQLASQVGACHLLNPTAHPALTPLPNTVRVSR